MSVSIEQIENFFPEDISKFVSQYYIRKAQYRYGEIDKPNQEPTGLTAQSFLYQDKTSHYIDDDSRMIYDSFVEYIDDRYNGFSIENQYIRLYCNCFAPREYGTFHTDSDDSGYYTFLYYPVHEYDYDIEEGGWTEFHIDDKILGIIPKPNSIVRFSSQIIHRATPMRNHTRFSVALKSMPK